MYLVHFIPDQMIDDEQTVSVQIMLYFTLSCTLVVKLQKNKLTGT